MGEYSRAGSNARPSGVDSPWVRRRLNLCYAVGSVVLRYFWRTALARFSLWSTRYQTLSWPLEAHGDRER